MKNKMIINKTLSHLLKAQEIERLINDQLLPSIQITLAQDASEHAFRSILYAMCINRLGDHRLDEIARKNRNKLQDTWFQLEPLLDEYAWLWELRNISRYSHADSPAFSEPIISKEMTIRAIKIVNDFLLIAKKMV